MDDPCCGGPGCCFGCYYYQRFNCCPRCYAITSSPVFPGYAASFGGICRKYGLNVVTAFSRSIPSGLFQHLCHLLAYYIFIHPFMLDGISYAKVCVMSSVVPSTHLNAQCPRMVQNSHVETAVEEVNWLVLYVESKLK